MQRLETTQLRPNKSINSVSILRKLDASYNTVKGNATGYCLIYNRWRSSLSKTDEAALGNAKKEPYDDS